MLAAAIHNEAPKLEATRLRADCDTLAATVAAALARNESQQQRLAAAAARAHELDGSIAHQRAMRQTAEADPARLRLAQLEGEVSTARTACEQVRVAVGAARTELATALAEKDAIVMRAVNTEHTSLALKSLDIPSLNSPMVARKSAPPKQAGKDKWADVSRAPWYAGKVDREECVRRLLSPMCTIGYFCIRDGASATNPYSLSFRGAGAGPESVRHMRVMKDLTTGKFKLAKRRPDNFEAESLSDLVGYYLNMDVGYVARSRVPSRRARLKHGTEFC